MLHEQFEHKTELEKRAFHKCTRTFLESSLSKQKRVSYTMGQINIRQVSKLLYFAIAAHQVTKTVMELHSHYARMNDSIPGGLLQSQLYTAIAIIYV